MDLLFYIFLIYNNLLRLTANHYFETKEGEGLYLNLKKPTIDIHTVFYCQTKCIQREEICPRQDLPGLQSIKIHFLLVCGVGISKVGSTLDMAQTWVHCIYSHAVHPLLRNVCTTMMTRPLRWLFR